MFNHPSLIVTRELSAADVLTWDSFNHVNLIIAVEMEFGIRIPSGEVGTMKNVGDLIDLIDKMKP